MSEKVTLKFTLEDTQFLKDLSPVNWTADESSALTKSEEIDNIDVNWIKDNVSNIVEAILSNTPMPTTINIRFYNDAGEAYYKLDIIALNIGVKLSGSINTAVTVSKELLDHTKFITDNLSSEIHDIYLRSMSTSFLSKTVEGIKKTLGMPTSDLGSTDNLDKLIEQISQDTKAEVVKPKETLADYVCNDLLRKELKEIVDFFDNYTVYRDANIDIPKGILFKGPWGTGKTFAARCIAGTVNCYFMTCTASALQGMYIGSGAENIRKVFKGAKLLAEKSKKGVILFIDELDSFGDRAHRGGNSSGEEDRTLNQLLAEMSGFEDNSNVMVLAATNFPERLDSALMRSGRFGRQITIDYPDAVERQSLVEHYFSKRKLPIESSTSYAEIADLTVGLTPADIKEISNEAAILSVREKHSVISLDNVNEAINKVITKNIRHPDKDTETLKLVTAHECGHVVAEVVYNKTTPIKVTNYAYGDAGGFTQSGSLMTGILSKDRYLNEVRILLGGRAAEQIYCNYITNGASNDLEKAKRLLRHYYETYNFETYDVSKLDQIVLDRLDTLYKEVITLLKSDKVKPIMTNLINQLMVKRVLYTSDIVLSTASLGGFKIC